MATPQEGAKYDDDMGQDIIITKLGARKEGFSPQGSPMTTWTDTEVTINGKPLKGNLTLLKGNLEFVSGTTILRNMTPMGSAAAAGRRRRSRRTRRKTRARKSRRYRK